MAYCLVVDEASGRRLERFIHSRWDRDRGGIRGLAKEARVSADAIHGWFRGAEPSLGALERVATVLDCRVIDLVAVLYGDSPVVELDGPTREVVAELIAAEVDRRLSRSDLETALLAEQWARQQLDSVRQHRQSGPRPARD